MSSTINLAAMMADAATKETGRIHIAILYCGLIKIIPQDEQRHEGITIYVPYVQTKPTLVINSGDKTP